LTLDIFDKIKDQQDNWDFSFKEFKNAHNLDPKYFKHLNAIQQALSLK